MSVVSSVCSSTSTDSIDLRVSHRMLRSTLRFLKDNIGIVSDVVINKIDKNVDILHKETYSEHLTKKDKDILKKSEKVLQTSVSLFKDSLRQMTTALTEIQEIYDDRIVPTLEQTHEAELKVQPIKEDQGHTCANQTQLSSDNLKVQITKIKENDSNTRADGENRDQQQQQQPATNISDELVLQYNPKDFNLNPKGARFFVIKTRTDVSIHDSLRLRLWCSTEHGNKRMNAAFKERENKGPVFLFFSVTGSCQFCGMAQMMTNVDFNADIEDWKNTRYKGMFAVKWIYLKNVPSSHLRHIRLENNENMPVTCSRDTQEMSLEKGKQVLKIMHNYRHTSSILEDVTQSESKLE
ncbi:YTH domain-containing family protein 2-like [Mytilus edulis]|uniref:YTH domain-containing family protein 2-like n=1 Tax=Mytilus edulis TaxID=6550 RepID=UPI0039F0DFF0